MRTQYKILTVSAILLVIGVVYFMVATTVQAMNSKYVCKSIGPGLKILYGLDTLQELDEFYDTTEVKVNCYIDGRYTEKSCYYDNRHTRCGKSIFCPSHVSKKTCITNGGSWEFETLERDRKNWQYFDVAFHPEEVPEQI